MKMKSKIITREWINDDFVFRRGNDSFDKSQIVQLINQWKALLFRKNVKKGDTIGLCTSVLDEKYFSLFFAATELGMKFVVFQRPEMMADLENYKLQIFKPIDYIVYDSLNRNNRVVKEFIIRFSNYTFSIDEVTEFRDVDYISNLIVATEDSDILLTTSSGTTNKPKLISHTHKFFYDLCKRNSSVMNFEKDDNVMHIRNLHHGSSLGVFFLPSIFSCNNHYSCEFEIDKTDTLLSQLNEYNITKLSVPYNSVIEEILASSLDYPNLTIFNLAFLQQSWIKACKSNKVKSIKSIFGCNETSGPIFLPSIDSDIEDFDPKNVGKMLDDFYQIKLEKNTLNVFVGAYDKFISTGDRFDVIDNNFIFLGKDQSFRINDIFIDVEDYKNFVSQNVSYPHIVVFDQEQEKIYLGITDDLDAASIGHYKTLNKKIKQKYSDLFQISNVKYIVREEHLYGIKIDHEKLRKFFRGEDVKEVETQTNNIVPRLKATSGKTVKFNLEWININSDL